MGRRLGVTRRMVRGWMRRISDGEANDPQLETAITHLPSNVFTYRPPLALSPKQEVARDNRRCICRGNQLIDRTEVFQQ